MERTGKNCPKKVDEKTLQGKISSDVKIIKKQTTGKGKTWSRCTI